jgi:trehalose 6-phosphate synthase
VLREGPRELRPLVKDLQHARGVRDASHVSWSPKALKEILQTELSGDEILIVSNREPYIHVRNGDKIEVQVPASGLVTALEPVMRACSGTWIAHGSGSADREVVDRFDRVRVPPDDPCYQIRRLWLNREEEKGFYYGFANEGLWPLCHIAHNRPTFRHEDWKQYLKVNQKFADAVVQEAKTDDPVVLVQDYHFALLPAMVKKVLPRATVITFWHIPWPNSESFGICPWREEILDGMLGSDILGFHTRFHCNNFLDSVDRFLESKIDRDISKITHQGRETSVHHYPISIDFPMRALSKVESVARCRENVRGRLGIGSTVRLGIGVDRLDYTKGILERFRAVERLLELEPGWVGKFSFVQIASPSRTSITRYQDFGQEVRDLCASINQRFGRLGYLPIHLLVQHHEPWEVYEYFRASETCVVSSLHDGMNLVAKEFVASRDDEQGVLILSQFTGAARELPEALIINPYDTDQVAAAMHFALSMTPQEQQARMRSMRALIQEFNIYRWAGRMLTDAARIRRQSKLSRKILSHARKKAVLLST